MEIANTRNMFTQYKKRGFTLVEVMVAALIASFILISAYYLLSGALKGFQKGSSKLEAMRTCRNALEHLRQDIQKAVNNIIVEEAGGGTFPNPIANSYILKLSQFALDDGGYPQPDPGGSGFKEIKVEYAFDGANLVRTVEMPNGDRSERVIAKSGVDSTIDIAFSIKELPLEGREQSVPTVMIEMLMEFEEGESKTTARFRTVAVPRYLAKWAAQPNWVINSIANKIKLGD